MKIAIVGSGIAGNVVARRLHRAHDIVVFEAASHAGGHAHTHSVEAGGERHEVDTGFMVFNDWTYPNFIGLLEELRIESQPSSMSFSVRNEASGLEYNGSSLDGLFAQRRNLLRPSFHRMLRDILRFNREAPGVLSCSKEESLGIYLRENRYSRAFIDDYLVPMGAAIWSTDPARMLRFPAAFFVRFLHNHGMLSVNARPQWRTVRGGSARYVEKLVAPFRHRIRLNTPVRHVRRLPDSVIVNAERFDYVFFACHADQALAALADASALEREVLGAIPYQENEAVLHTDTSLLPRARRAWAAWNYHVPARPAARVALTYNLNILQNLPARETFCVTLNRSADIDPRRILRHITYHHPLYTRAAVAAQRHQGELNGENRAGHRSYFCGAYWRYGFHEDGVVSALAALAHFEGGSHAQRDLPRVA